MIFDVYDSALRYIGTVRARNEIDAVAAALLEFPNADSVRVQQRSR